MRSIAPIDPSPRWMTAIKSLCRGKGALMRAGVLSAAIFLSMVGLAAGSDAEAAIRRSTHIPAQGLGPALQSLAKEHDFQVLYRTEIVGELRTGGAVGELTASEALTQLLSGTGLTYRYLDEKTVTVIPLSAQSAPAETSAGVANDATAAAQGQSVIELEEVVVTGTHIRGVQNSASPVLRFDRAEIVSSGLATTEQFIQSLPQNFGGGSTAMTASAIRGGEGYVSNYAQGTGANLRALGNDSTLVLLNGRRLAPIGVGNFVDLSLIPLDAVERIEVLTDGA